MYVVDIRISQKEEFEGGKGNEDEEVIVELGAHRQPRNQKVNEHDCKSTKRQKIIIFHDLRSESNSNRDSPTIIQVHNQAFVTEI